MHTTETSEDHIGELILEWTRNSSCEFDTAVDLTFRHDPKTIEFASKQFRHFMYKLNDACMGNNWSRRANIDPSKRLPVVPIIESGFDKKRLHYHCLFARPKQIDIDFFRLKVDLCWSMTYTGSWNHNMTRDIYNYAGLVDYVTKELSTKHTQKLDAENLHIY